MALAHCEFDLQKATGGFATGGIVNVEVRNEATSALARLYSDRAGTTPVANPLTVTDAMLSFYTVGGAYKIAMTGAGISRPPLRHYAIGTAAEADIEAVGQAGYAFTFTAATDADDLLPGEVCADNADLSSATKLFFSAVTLGGANISATLIALGIGDYARITVADADAVFAVGGTTDNTGDAAPHVEVAISGHDGSTALAVGTARLNIERTAGGDVTGPASATDKTLPRFDTTTGKLLQGSGISVDDSDNMTGVGNIGFAGQLAFPATQSASSNANTLDDYEEGTWTPAIEGSSTAGTYTYTAQVGNYIKIGKLVFLTFAITIDAVSSAGSGGILITGHPFTRAEGNLRDAGNVGTAAGLAALPSNFSGWAIRGFNSATFQIMHFDSTSAENAATAIGTVVGAGTDLRGHMIYRTTA